MKNLKLYLNVKMLKYLNAKMTKRGVSIYLALMIMFILLAVGLGMSAIIVSQMKMVREMGYSVIALYAADTGIERALDAGDTPSSDYSDTLINGSSYKVEVYCCVPETGMCLFGAGECPVDEDSKCDARYFCYKSIGTYRKTQRAIETTR